MKTSLSGKASRASQTKSKTLSRFMMTSALVAAGSFSFISPAHAVDIELPVLGAVTNGAATTDYSVVGQLDVNQSTDRVIINWNTFNIGADATVQFYQPNSGSLAVNKVTDSVTFTRIDGKLKANGKVVILDPNGIIFGENSVTDVGAIVASTGDINNLAVMAGGLMQLTNFGTGQIVNNGAINAADSGLVAFVGSTVKNSGVIRAKLGRVSLAAGNETATVDLYGDGLVELSYTNKNEDLLSENTGKIKAVGGTIQMTAAQAKDTVDSVVNMKGIAKANSAVVLNGKIILSGKKVKIGSGAKVKGNTKITAQSVDLDATIKGTVEGSAKEVNILSNAAKISQGLDVIDTFGTINVYDGTYNEHLVISKKGVTLKSLNGASETTIIPNSPGVTITADNVTVDGFTFTGATGLDGYGIFVNGGNQATIKNNVIKNNSQEGIYIIDSWKSIIDGNWITDTGSHGIYAKDSDLLNIRHNQIGVKKGGAFNIKGDGILLDNSQSASIFNNRITQTKSTVADIGNGIQLRRSNNAELKQNTIFGTDWDGIRISKSHNVTALNNDIDNVKRVGIFAIQSKDLTVLNNDIYGSLLRGVRVDRMIGASLITGNKINNSGVDGITVSLSNDATVENNFIGYGDDGLFNTKDDTSTGEHGIRVTDSSNVDIIGNKIAHTGLSGIYAINSQDIEVGTGFTKNSINFTGSHGIQVINSNGAKIIANQVGVMKGGANNINGDGIYVENSHDALILVNRIAKTTSTVADVGSGIHVKNSDNVNLVKNTAYELAWDGIKITGGDTISLRNNVITNAERTGIFAKDGSNFTATNNSVYDTGRDGLGMWDMYGSNNISSNKINKIGIDGIKVLRSDNTTIANNFIGYGDDAALGGDDTNIGRDGVRVEGSSNVSVNNNKIVNAAENGVHAIDVSGLVTINGNTINNSGNDGILVDGYEPSTIFIFGKSKNIVTPLLDLPALNGLYVNGNTITDSGNNGISILNPTGYVEVIGNTITNSGNDGIYVSNYSPSYDDYAPIFALNDSENEGDNFDYMPVFESGLYINDNVITNSGTEASSESEYAKSYLAEGDGIDVNNASGYVEISGNDINNSAQNGIYVHGYNNQMYSRVSESEMYISIPIWESNLKLLIDNNFVNESGFNGVYLSNLEGDLTVSNNEIYNSGNNGVSTEYVNQYGAIYGPYDVMSAKKELFVTDYPASYLTQLIITGNDIDNSEYDGVNLYQTGGYVSVDNNTITDSGRNGIYAYNYSSSWMDDYGVGKVNSLLAPLYPVGSNPIDLHIVDNTIENIGFVPNQDGESVVAEAAPNGFAAINLDITGDGYAEISGNTMGNNFEYGIFARSGAIDLTGATNTIQNTDIGMGFYPYNGDVPPEVDTPEYFDFLANQLRLVDDTIGTTAFIDQADFFVDLGYGAFFAPGTPTILNGNDATYTLGGTTIAPSVYGGVTQAEYDVLEARFNHFVDFQNRGLFFFNILPDLLTFDQEDVFRTFNFPTEFGQGGSLIVTGLPRIAGVAAPVAGGFNPNAIEPAAGGDETTGGDAAAAGIEPAAGGATNSACWADATQALGQGTSVSFNFGGGSSALLQDAANCGSGTNDQNL